MDTNRWPGPDEVLEVAAARYHFEHMPFPCESCQKREECQKAISQLRGVAPYLSATCDLVDGRSHARQTYLGIKWALTYIKTGWDAWPGGGGGS